MFQVILVAISPYAEETETLGGITDHLYPEQLYVIHNPASRNILYAQALDGCRQFGPAYVIGEINWYGDDDGPLIGCVWRHNASVRSTDECWNEPLVRQIFDE